MSDKAERAAQEAAAQRNLSEFHRMVRDNSQPEPDSFGDMFDSRPDPAAVPRGREQFDIPSPGDVYGHTPAPAPEPLADEDDLYPDDVADVAPANLDPRALELAGRLPIDLDPEERGALVAAMRRNNELRSRLGMPALRETTLREAVATDPEDGLRRLHDAVTQQNASLQAEAGTSLTREQRAAIASVNAVEPGVFDPGGPSDKAHAADQIIAAGGDEYQILERLSRLA